MGGMKFGCARTSTYDQTTALQLAALKRARCPHTHEDEGLAGAHAKRLRPDWPPKREAFWFVKAR
jgi:DNA invertase Pin-like site-specific DNA recombinase